MRPGKLIVIDGIDGSGKMTQTNLLAKKLKKLGHKVMIADFPQYGKPSALLAENYLNGKFGNANEVGPYRASIFFACDRYAASLKMKKFISQGGIVVSNRYVTANMGHQGGKIKDGKERKKYFRWLYDLEYNIFQIPKPDLNIILHVDIDTSQKLVDKKNGKKNRNYIVLKGGKDIHETDVAHLRNSERTFLEISKIFPDFKLIKCLKNGRLMTKKEISDNIWAEISKCLSL
jgi:dTMP kinase